MLDPRILGSVALAACVAALGNSVCAQRTTVLVGPPALGRTCSVEHWMPVSQAPLVGGFLWSAPYAGAVPVPGLAVNGLLRVDPATFVALGIGASTGAPPLAMSVMVPNQATLLGVQLDCQSFDLDATSTFQLAGNDVLLTIVSGPPAGLDMVAIPPGTFLMGSPALLGAEPVHPVTISRPFWMGRYEVTQAQYQSVMGSNPSSFQGASHPNAPQRPVERVTWNDVVAYCQALTANEAAAGRLPAGYVYRLPTEAEWEYCCRAGTTTEFHYGASLHCGQAQFYFNSQTNLPCPNPGGALNETKVVGSYAPNAFGLHDMHGNVYEWCLDNWDGSANYPAGSVTDPLVTVGPYRAIRGGRYGGSSNECRSAYRQLTDPTSAICDCLGFRVVCAPVLP